ncbi:MAG: hypothetical protein WC408_04205 [Candidatus Micrarchaeia archaeon]
MAEKIDTAYADKTIETIVDRLYDLVKAKKTASITEVSRALSISESQTEKLARLLESSKLVQLNYALSETTIAIPEEAAAAQAKHDEYVDKPVSQRALVSVCDDVARAKAILEFSQRQILQIGKKIEQAAADAKKIQPQDITPQMRKQLEALIADAASAKAYAKSTQDAVAKIEDASKEIAANNVRKGAR